MIICTNPPFSCIREFIAQLVKYNKKFLFIGHMGIATYKKVFTLFKENKIWYGTRRNMHMWFKIPNDAPYKTGQKEENGIRYQDIAPVAWFTNLDHSKRNKPQELTKSYIGHEDEYPKYDNYDAIEVSKTNSIPNDYYDVMGVPVTWLRYYCPEQFEIIGLDRYTIPKDKLVSGGCALNGKVKYVRIFIRRRQ